MWANWGTSFKSGSSEFFRRGARQGHQHRRDEAPVDKDCRQQERPSPSRVKVIKLSLPQASSFQSDDMPFDRSNIRNGSRTASCRDLLLTMKPT